MATLLIRGGTIVTMNPSREIIQGDVLVDGDRIAAAGASPAEREGFVREPDRVIDARGKVVIPGLVQTHVHLCQALFRGLADDLELLDWLRKRIWPLEAAHDEDSIYWSAMVGAGELIKGGTTCILDMETVHHTDSALRAIAEIGIRATAGKVMMDHGAEVPAGLMETAEDSLQESVDLLEKWHNQEGGRIRYAFSPRFVVSCTEGLLKEVAELAERYGVQVHTHASENRGEVELVMEERGRRNVTYLEDIGLVGGNVLLAHCIWLDDEEMSILERTGTRVLHCPGSNLKLASGMAMIDEMLERGISVSLGADGPPCNNNLDMWREMRLASFIQKVRRGPTALPAAKVFELATIEGAKALGLEREIGSLEPGKKADLAVLDLSGLHVAPRSGSDLISQLVYSAGASDVVHTVIDGRVVMEDRRLLTRDEGEIVRRSEEAVQRLLARTGI